MARYYANVALHLVSAVHLSVSSVMHYINYIPPSVFPIDSAFSGKFKYLTFWNVCIEAGFFCLTVIDDVLQRRSDSGKSPLKGFLDYMYTSIIFPVSMIVGTAFWGLYLVDRELVLPKSLDPYFPTWLNHSVHSFIVLYAILEMLTTYRPLPPVGKSISGLYALIACYVSWMHVVYYVSGMWVYPIFAKLTWPYRIAFLFGNFVTATGFFFIGRYANTFIWKKRIEKSTLQIN